MTKHPITFPQFKTAIEAIIAHEADINEFTTAIQGAFDGCYAICSLGQNSTTALINLLNELVDSDGWVGWYIYECDGGKTPRYAYLADKTEIKVDSIEKLWEVICA